MVASLNVPLIVGLALEFGGTLLAARGLVQTWQSYRRGEPLMPPAWGRFVQRLRALPAGIRSALPGRRGGEIRVTVHPPTVALTAQAHDAIVEIQEDLSEDHDEALKTLHQRYVALRDRVTAIERELRGETRRVRSELKSDLAVESEERKAADLRTATEGVQRAFLGLGLVLVGLALQLGAAVWAAV